MNRLASLSLLQCWNFRLSSSNRSHHRSILNLTRASSSINGTSFDVRNTSLFFFFRQLLYGWSRLLTQYLHRNENVSHITAGYIYNSPSQKLVRVDQAYDGGLASSSFDYSNVTDTGLVDNIFTTFSGSLEKIEVWRGYVNSNFPLFSEGILVESGAVFGGLIKRQLITDRVASVSHLNSLTLCICDQLTRYSP